MAELPPEAVEARARIEELCGRRDALEAELAQCVELTRLYPRLVDDEGYPLPDVPHQEVAEARRRGLCLRNDLRALQREIEALLPAAFGK